VNTAATIKVIIPEAPKRETFLSSLKSIKAKDSFNIPTKSLNHEGSSYTLNSSIISIPYYPNKKY
jgi:hypothetical protein